MSDKIVRGKFHSFCSGKNPIVYYNNVKSTNECNADDVHTINNQTKTCINKYAQNTVVLIA